MKNNILRILKYDLPLHFVLLVTNWLPDLIIFIRFRGYLAHFFLGSCKKDLRLGRNITFYNPQNIHIGKNVYIAYGNWFSAGEKITIEDEVIVGPSCIFSSSQHTKINGSFRYGTALKNPICIGKGSWITAQCNILAGTNIGKGVLVATNSVTSGNLKSDMMYGGSPAKIIKEIR